MPDQTDLGEASRSRHPWDDLAEEQLEEIEDGYRCADDPNEPYPAWHDDF